MEMEPLSLPLLPFDNFDELLQQILENSESLLKPEEEENGVSDGDHNGDDVEEEAVVPSGGQGKF